MTETKKRKMSAAQRRERKRKIRNRRIAMTFALVLVVALVSVSGTIAWLTSKTNPVVNTFTVGDIDITLEETKGPNFKMVPGNEIEKDPKVTVLADSEKCYLFVKVDESTNLKDFITYTMESGWIQLKDTDNNNVNGVYYRVVDASNTNQTFSVLNGDKVTVNSNVTKEMMNGLEAQGAIQPTLTFTAYACQWDNIADAYAAWLNAKDAAVPTT